MMSMSMQESPKGRPFFRSLDDLYDDEYYDELNPEKKRRLTHDQVCSIFLHSSMFTCAALWNKVEVVENC